MEINKKKKLIKCYKCDKYYDLSGIYVNVLYEGSITCWKDHLLGYTWDVEWLILTLGEKNEQNKGSA